MKKYKARITKENLEKFKREIRGSEKLKALDELFHQKFYGNWNIVHSTPSKCHDSFKYMFGLGWITHKDYEIRKDTFENLDVLISYMELNHVKWNVELLETPIMYISFSGNYYFWLSDYCELEELPDYDGISMAELHTIGAKQPMSMLPAEMNSLSVNDVKEQKKGLNEKEAELKKKLDDIQCNRTEELQKLNEEIKKMEARLRERKNALQAEINEKISAINEQISEMNKQIYMMESEIYVMRSYSGETSEFHKVRNGKKAAPESPLIINQKLIYLDEDLARIVSIYKEEIAAKYQLFSDAVTGCDEVFEAFCPQERCLTFFRLSNSATYHYYNGEHRMYETEELIHGKKMGFLLRDGECAYVGWLDETWGYDDENPRYVSFTGEFMYKPEKKTEIRETGDSDILKLKRDSQNTMLSRVFAASVVQGILDNGKVLEFPETVNVMKPSQYIIYNYADGWITDDRFGDFATLVENLNKRTKVNDPILITYNKSLCSGRGEADRAHDCKVPEGINKVNYLESDEYGRCNIYVSAKKRYSSCGATANVLVRTNEYINIAYMNSIWLMYYVQTKKMGAYAEDYAKMIKHFKRAIEIIKTRETEEMAAIKKFYPEADQIPEWEIKLSHWKLHHNIRFITDYQAKRVAKYFKTGEFYEIKNLFNKETYYPNDDFKKRYARTKFYEKGYKGIFIDRNASEFAVNSLYAEESFYIEQKESYCETKEEIVEENKRKVDEELPALIQSVPERIKKDERKLEQIGTYIENFMQNNAVILSEYLMGRKLSEFLYRRGNAICFKRIEELSAEERKHFYNAVENMYPKYILTSDCWKVAYCDYIHLLYTDELHEIEMYRHKKFMESVTYS